MKLSCPPFALLLTSSHCPHCHVMKTLLEPFYSGSCTNNLKIVNIEQEPDIAQSHQVRSVPWLKIGMFEFDGVLDREDLSHWLSAPAQENNVSRYLEYLLLNGKLIKAIAWLNKYRVGLDSVLSLLAKDDIKLNVRIGIGAILEEYEGQPELIDLVPELGKLVSHHNPTIRADVCHYLMLSHSEPALAMITMLLDDENAQVRANAHDSIEEF